MRANMKQVVVVGAGKIGSAIAEILAMSGDYRVTITDQSETALAPFSKTRSIAGRVLDIRDEAALANLLGGKFAVISAAPYHLTTGIARAALTARVHYIDLTEDVASTREIEKMAGGNGMAMVPQCGLAPGFVSIVAGDLARRFDTLDSLRLRVGALPQYPSNALSYNLTWSTEGVINEYCEPCEAIADGRRVIVPALEECEGFAIDGVAYEAFNTSGGLGTLCDSLDGRVRTLNYRSIRYPGHGAIMKALLNDLRLRDRRDILKDIFENALPATMQDVVVIMVTASGMREGRLVQETYARKIYSGMLAGKLRSAIQITTASSACAILDLLATGQIRQSGALRQEEIPLDLFLSNRFGAAFSGGDSEKRAA
jgi:saccharopine dehydrogenase-like NADP-dependent oxidoreductase